MMQPKFDDVIEYVQAGEDDPDLKKLLDLHPDGKEILKQARFICRMLDLEVGKDSDKGRGFIAGSVSLDRMAEPMNMARLSIDETFATEQRVPAKRRMGRVARPPEELGTLELTFEEERVALSFEPGEQDDELVSFLVDVEPPKQALAGIHIHGRSIRLSMPDSVPAGEPLTVHLSHGARQMPAKGQRMIFMPESGAFLKLTADDNGRVSMPVPEQPGTLRVDTSITELLRIRVNK